MLPRRRNFIQEVVEPTAPEFLQEVIEPQVQIPVEPELLQEIVEEAPVEEDNPSAKKHSAPKIGGRIQKAVNRAKTTIQSRK